MKGRAREMNSTFQFVINYHEIEDFNEQKESLHNTIKYMKKYAYNDQSKLKPDLKGIKQLKTYHEFAHRIPTTQATITMNNSIELLEKFITHDIIVQFK